MDTVKQEAILQFTWVDFIWIRYAHKKNRKVLTLTKSHFQKRK